MAEYMITQRPVVSNKITSLLDGLTRVTDGFGLQPKFRNDCTNHKTIVRQLRLPTKRHLSHMLSQSH